MEDVISLSSASEEDSDVEIVGSYEDSKRKGIPFIRAELLPVTPVLINIGEHLFPPYGPMHQHKGQRLQCSAIKVIDLKNGSHLGEAQLQSITSARPLKETGMRCLQQSFRPRGNIQRLHNSEDVICLDSSDGAESPVCVSQAKSKGSTKRPGAERHLGERLIQGTVSILAADSHYSSCVGTLDSKEIKALEHSPLFSALNYLPASPPSHVAGNSNDVEGEQNTIHPARTSASPAAKITEQLPLPQSCPVPATSPFNLQSLHYCSSDIDDMFFSEQIFVNYNKEPLKLACGFNQTLPQCDRLEKQHPHQHQSQISTGLPRGEDKPTTPTSTQILAGDSSDPVSELNLVLSSSRIPSSPSPPHLASCTDTVESAAKDFVSVFCQHQSSDQWNGRHTNGTSNVSSPETQETQEGQYISELQFKRLKHLIGGRVQDMPEAQEEMDGFGQAEPLCRQSLSLVYSTIEEKYPEGTLQLLSDFIQPCHYPPTDITAHLLKDILLDPHCAEMLAVEAYNLLMRTQKFHPADKSTIPWDWELLSSVMAEQDKVKWLRSEARCLLFQYALRVLEDDFQCKLSMLRLQLSIANEMLSCDQKFRHVRELVSWILDASKLSVSSSADEELQQREQNNCLKMLLILQRMLLLAVEVDLRPTCTSSKLSQELCNSLNGQAPCRRLRLLLLRTLESNLLRCKLVELLLDQACSHKKALPMSFKLLLHFLHNSTLEPDPSDGKERWKKWEELLQLLWMLMLSYQEVVIGHLRYSITERVKLTRAPMWTQNDQVSPAAVQEAAEALLSRVTKDLGHDPPVQIQKSLSELQEHLLSISLH